MKIRLPEQGWRRYSHRTEAVLLLCYYDPAGISTVTETIAFMQSQSKFSVTVINLFEHRQPHAEYLELSPRINFDRFAGVIIHNSVAYNIDNLRALEARQSLKFRDYGGVKVLMKQDENYRFHELAEYIGETGFDLIFTCLPPEAIPAVYPQDVVGSPRFERMLTGYVTPTLRSMNFENERRPVDIGYRGSIQPLEFGRLAYEKQRIADDIKSLLAGTDLLLDISNRWEDRFGGDAWFEFLRSCKATLGAESGATIFDLDGDLDERCKAIECKLGPFREGHAYAEAFLAELEDIENNIHYNQISPRHFEAIATGTIQLLYPGSYSGLLVAGRHYFQLERDYSNLDEAIALVRDDRRRKEMARLAFEEVILNKANWIESFVSRFDCLLDELISAKGVAAQPVFKVNRRAKNILLLAAHEPRIDPRLGWIEKGASSELCIHQLGVVSETAQAIIMVEKRKGVLLAYPKKRWSTGACNSLFALTRFSPEGLAGVQELLFMEHALKLSEGKFCELFGAPPDDKRNDVFRWYLQHFLDTSISLLDRALGMRGVHAIIATDLDTLAAALVLKGIMDIPVFYDAHEYWPEADVHSLEYEKQFWERMERRLVAHVDYCQTVSLGLAKLMSEQYQVPFECLPNCEPRGHLLLHESSEGKNTDEICRFLFLGSFAVGRGIDLLIKAWPETDERAILLLQGVDNAYKEQMVRLADKMGLLNSRILFPAAVPESDLIRTAGEADVGVIPYTATGANYKFCCPNKMSQYMAAGLPILANETDFVASTVRAANCGCVVDFAHKDQLLKEIQRLMTSAELRKEFGQAGQSYFRSCFNWDVVSAPFYQKMNEMITVDPEALRVFYGGDQQSILREKKIQRKTSLTYRILRWLWRSQPVFTRKILLPIARLIPPS